MYRLLIVDDEPVIVEGLATMLGASDLPFKEIKMAYSATEALAYFDEAPFDIVLADIRMPKINGLQMVDRIKHKSPASKIIFLSGYSDFEYARQAIQCGASDYLLKPIEDEGVVSSIEKVIGVLEKEYDTMLALQKAKQQALKSVHFLKEEFFHNLYEKTINPDLDTLKENFEEVGISFDPKQPITSSILFRIDHWDNHFESNDEPLLQFAVENILTEILGEACFVESFKVERGLVAILVQQKEENTPISIADILRQKLEEAQNTIHRVLGAVVSFALIPNPLVWSQWPDELNNLISTMKLHLGEGMLIVLDGEAPEYNVSEMTEVIQGVIQTINGNDVEAFEKYLNMAIQEIQSTSGSTVNAISSVFMTVSTHMLNQARKYNLNTLFSTSDMEKMTNLYKHKNLDEVQIFMVEKFKQLVNLVDSYSKNPAEVIANQVKSYVASHLDEDLSLDVLARMVYMNSSYLSRIFSQHTKEQLSVYITRTKMEYAKSLLVNDDFKIYEISKKVGYENPNYFAKVFKKSFGVSPQDFRLFN